MGYCSDFRLTIVEGEIDTRDLRNILVQQTGYTGWSIPYESQLELDYAKWYDYQHDMTRISLKYPEAKFELHCIGEDGQQWILDVFNGNTDSRTGVMTFPDRTLF